MKSAPARHPVALLVVLLVALPRLAVALPRLAVVLPRLAVALPAARRRQVHHRRVRQPAVAHLPARRALVHQVARLPVHQVRHPAAAHRPAPAHRAVRPAARHRARVLPVAARQVLRAALPAFCRSRSSCRALVRTS